MLTLSSGENIVLFAEFPDATATMTLGGRTGKHRDVHESQDQKCRGTEQ